MAQSAVACLYQGVTGLQRVSESCDELVLSCSYHIHVTMNVFYLQDKISGQQACPLCLASTVHTVKVLKSRKLWRWLKVEVSHMGVC